MAMWGVPWIFWLVLLFVFMSMRRRRRWERWAMSESGYGARGNAAPVRAELEHQRSYIEELEARIAQLEEKLDFTERLVSGRRDS
jgi:hypothetical protein